ncbi:MAG: xanthine phosphoribosyltransferase [Rhodospirillales bacterium]
MSGLQEAAKIHSCSWHEMHRQATDLAIRLAASGPFQGIIAIARGGTVPAAVVARVLDIRLIETLCTAKLRRHREGALSVLKGAPPQARRPWLAADRRRRRQQQHRREARSMLPAAHYATIYVKPVGRPFVDTFISEVEQDVWIDFPWDRDPAKIG